MAGGRILRAGQAGPFAAALLDGSPGRQVSGRVLAVFGAVIYVEFGTELLCVTRQGVDAGPLSLTTDAPEQTDFRQSGLTPGAWAILRDGCLHLGGRFRVDTVQASRWTPPVPGLPIHASGLRRLTYCVPSDIMDKGLGGFLLPGFTPAANDHVGRAAAGSVAGARRWLVHGGGTDWAQSLIGLGPGLTPSGDDFLGGMMIALQTFGRGELACELWSDIEAAAVRDTNRISAALMQAASAGVGGGSLHDAINALLGWGVIEPALERLSFVGHSSGWDALAGAVIVLDTLAASLDTKAA